MLNLRGFLYRQAVRRLFDAGELRTALRDAASRALRRFNGPPRVPTADSLPPFVQIEPVGQCNLACPMCSVPYRQDGPPGRQPAFMAFETFTRLIDQWPGLQELVLQGGGEPMMHSRLFDMVAYAARRGIRVTTVSNLTLLSPARAERCVTSGLDVLHVSVDGATAVTFERIRVGARFDQVVQNLELLRHARDRLRSTRPHLHLIMVVMRQNLHEVPEVVRLAHRWSMESMSVQHLAHDLGEHTLPAHYYPQREFVRVESLQGEDPRRRERYFREARQLARELGLKLRLPQARPYPRDILGHERCQWPWQKSYISYQGLAMPCCVVGAPDRINFGNVLELGIEQVWRGADYENFRRQLASAQPPDVCRSCGIYNGTC